ncbi:MAG: hypothetical protein ABI981_02880 [Betaproteobacteria bacterium]
MRITPQGEPNMASKRARRPITKTPETTPQANIALRSPEGTTQFQGAPKLPHERDESPTMASKPDAAIVQAERDLAQGQKDTDRYNDANKAFERGRVKQKRDG